MDDTQTPQTNPQEDEVVKETSELTQPENPENNVAAILQLETMINGYLMDLEKLQQQVKEQGQMLKDGLENDAEYAACLEKAKTVNKEKKTIQDKLMQEPSLALLNSKVKDLKEEVKDVQQGLSDYLQQYFQQSGLRQITGTDGEIREIVTHLKLVKKRE